MTQPSTFQKKPVQIQAIQWDGTAEGATPIIDWVLAGNGTATFSCQHQDAHDRGEHTLAIRTLEGTMQASPGDWIIRGIQGEFYPCKPDIFADSYEQIATL